MKKLITACFFLMLVVFFCRAKTEEQPLTNEVIVLLTRAETPTELIIEVIKKSKTNFDTPINILRKLQQEDGVSGEVVVAMHRKDYRVPHHPLDDQREIEKK